MGALYGSVFFNFSSFLSHRASASSVQVIHHALFTQVLITYQLFVISVHTLFPYSFHICFLNPFFLLFLFTPSFHHIYIGRAVLLFCFPSILNLEAAPGQTQVTAAALSSVRLSDGSSVGRRSFKMKLFKFFFLHIQIQFFKRNFQAQSRDNVHRRSVRLNNVSLIQYRYKDLSFYGLSVIGLKVKRVQVPIKKNLFLFYGKDEPLILFH